MKQKETLANNLKYYMNLHNKGRRAVCDALDLNYFTFSDWINAKKYPMIDKIEKLAAYFGISKADLIEERHSNVEVTVDTKKYEAVNFGTAISSARIANDMSVEELALKLGETPEKVRLYESSKVFPIQHLRKMHEIIGLSYYDLLGIKRLYSKIYIDLYKLDLSERQLKDVLQYAEFLKYKGGRSNGIL